MTSRLKSYVILMRFHQPIGILLLLWPTLWALWLAAGGLPELRILSVFISGIILMRAAGCVINDFADRNFDGSVQRTRHRPLATGHVSTTEAIVLFALLCGLAFCLVLLLNTFTLLLSCVALALAICYPFMKRFTHWPQLVLGIAFSWGIPMAFAAQTGHIPGIAWLLFITTVLWTIIYDTEYAMVDRADDLQIGIKSTAILFGRYDVAIISALQLMMISLLMLLGWVLHLKTSYYAGIAVSALFFIYQQRLIATRKPEACFNAFLNNNWIGLTVFIGLILGI